MTRGVAHQRCCPTVFFGNFREDVGLRLRGSEPLHKGRRSGFVDVSPLRMDRRGLDGVRGSYKDFVLGFGTLWYVRVWSLVGHRIPCLERLTR